MPISRIGRISTVGRCLAGQPRHTIITVGCADQTRPNDSSADQTRTSIAAAHTIKHGPLFFLPPPTPNPPHPPNEQGRSTPRDRSRGASRRRWRRGAPQSNRKPRRRRKLRWQPRQGRRREGRRRRRQPRRRQQKEGRGGSERRGGDGGGSRGGGGGVQRLGSSEGGRVRRDRCQLSTYGPEFRLLPYTCDRVWTVAAREKMFRESGGAERGVCD